MNPASVYSSERPTEDQGEEFAARRMFLTEPGWVMSIKAGSDRVFCYMMAPGQDYYHRLLDGEIFLVRDDERLCLGCAARRGLLAFQPRRLRESVMTIPADLEPIPLELDDDDSDW
jgi:hypothetical protein